MSLMLVQAHPFTYKRKQVIPVVSSTVRRIKDEWMSAAGSGERRGGVEA